MDDKLLDELYGTMKCDTCGKSPIRGVAAIPFIPMSVAYCQECLSANAHPWWALVANQACIRDPLEDSHPEWQQMVADTCAHLGKTREQFDADVAESIAKEQEAFGGPD